MLIKSRLQFIIAAALGYFTLYWLFKSSLLSLPLSSFKIQQCRSHPLWSSIASTHFKKDDPNAVAYTYINMNDKDGSHNSSRYSEDWTEKQKNNSSSQQSTHQQQHHLVHNDGNDFGHVLILTPFKQSVQFIDRYFDNVKRLTYPHHLISLGFLVSDSTDGTIEKLRERAQLEMDTRQQAPSLSSSGEESVSSWNSFDSISIFQKDYQYDLPANEDRHAFNVQITRRNIMAKSRNTLLSAALTEKHDWVLWLDGDVIEYPETLLEELMAMDKDMIVPNCYWHSYNEEGGYDKNNWQETEESLAFQKTLPEDQVLVEGYPELITHRKLMIDMRFENNQTDLFYAVPLDAVGGTCTLVKAKVHRNGAIFPPFPYQHQVETEGLAKMAKALGYEVWGLPNYLVYHYI